MRSSYFEWVPVTSLYQRISFQVILIQDLSITWVNGVANERIFHLLVWRWAYLFWAEDLTYCANFKKVCHWWLAKQMKRNGPVGRPSGLQEEDSSEATKAMLRHPATSHISRAFWSTAASQKQCYEAFLSAVCTSHILVVSRCIGFAVKDSMSLKGKHESDLERFYVLNLTESSVNLWARWGISRD